MMEKQKRVWLSKEEKAAHMSAWQESKLSKRDYCKQNQICYGTFLKWLIGNRKRKSKKITGSFIPIEIKQAEVTDSLFASISYGNQFRIELHQPVNSGFIKELLRSCR